MTARRLSFVFSSALAAGALLALAGADDPAPTHAPTPADQAPSRMTIPPGFTVKPFAAEPDVLQPIAFTIDARGRLWVVENFSYPIWLEGPRGKDRIVIFEDSDGDGRFDSRKVFYEGGKSFTGIELGFGGVWVCDTPNLLFIPDADGDDQPDASPAVVLDGWDVKAQHNMFNGLKWGPDGWLWGLNGILSNSLVGAPGTADADRTAINTGVWRYHPTRKVFEAVAHGTTNPWGLDFDDHGEAFITNCVIPHLFHVVPGARFDRMFGEDFNTNTYQRIPTCADHLHWAGGHWTESREGAGHDKHSLVGGGHAHVGAMIYLGGSWPDSYRDGVYTFNIHGHRVNHDRLERKGSSYVAHHEPDLLRVDDVWFRGLELKYGPDGAVYFTDWADIGECHENDADGSHRENGRIYKMTYGEPQPVTVDLAKQTDAELAGLQSHKNEWYVRTARRILQERAAAGGDMTAARTTLQAMFRDETEAPRRLRALWALNAVGALDEPALLGLLADRDDSVRGWAVRLLVDRLPIAPAVVAKLAEAAKTETSPRARLALTSALQRIPVADRRPLAETLAAAEIDPADPMLPLMTWYGIEPLAAEDLDRAAALVTEVKLPMLRNFLARRMVSADPAGGLAALAPVLKLDRDELRSDVLDGVLEAFRGRKQVPRPEGWADLYAGLSAVKSPEVLEKALLLAVTLDEPKAVEALRATLLDPKADAGRRQVALTTLVERRIPGLERDLPGLLADDALRARALRAMAAFADPDVPRIVLDRYPTLTPAEREDAVATLAARPAWALALLDAVEAGTVPRRDVSVTTARQIQALGDAGLSHRLEVVWGTVRATSADKASLIGKYKAVLTAGAPDLANGRAVYERTCNACHKLFDAGGDVGPELTGSDRANADYILENVLDPSATVAREYTVTNVATADGRLVSGILRAQTDAVLTIQTANERIILPREDVEEVKASNISMMPEGQLEALSPQEIRDLFAYLASPSQVAPAATK
ncbi:PVC-type heme-binding CxxCH protein [Planctomyces sp. SH-PL62]|uniref:PVC-type heme-binding CxxCH protein n=1 Tax=Planctomyces sp. SH-PL62 TaxID=1636152 RepID=UPI00078C53D6|nr:PVC-type heme-binding CxxCH protein [Planctomyces sp. SH-PL62]AMV40696.1 Cytochrome c [Planctomyces sp. SH-PL62]